MKVCADDAALLLGIEHVLEARQKHFRCVTDGESDAELAGENVFHPLALARAQQTSVDEYALEPLADRAMNQRRRDRRIDAARKAEQHLVVRADLARISATLVSMKFAIVQSPGSPQISCTKLRSTCVPHGVCTTSG